MKLYLVFLAIPFFTVSNASDIPDLFNILITQGSKECLAEAQDLVKKLKETKNQHDAEFGNIDILYNRKLMISLINNFKSISSFIKSSNCSTSIFIKYFLDGAVFIGDQIYGEAFICLSEIFLKEDLEPKFTDCANSMVPKDSEVLDYLKPVSFCVASKIQCSKEDQKALIVAVHAGVDLFEMFSNGKEILEKIEKNQMKLEFQPEKYAHLLS
ncbi:Protein CBG15083 [Caenorhabditis briggsae]|uniref:Protein CBG15083 n=1 Tax=Caenorhabditis briggsae TaxID=6238 RepID=A8XLC6_CAEBR|nr:Protein CBG15083 [Caenorhabditis briggsae]CAP33451.2 Protein CBG15083 [Caenorhabditis briggsae]